MIGGEKKEEKIKELPVRATLFDRSVRDKVLILVEAVFAVRSGDVSILKIQALFKTRIFPAVPAVWRFRTDFSDIHPAILVDCLRYFFVPPIKAVAYPSATEAVCAIGGLKAVILCHGFLLLKER